MGSSFSLQGCFTKSGLWELVPKPGLLQEDLMEQEEIKSTTRINEQWNSGQRKLRDPHPWRSRANA